MNFSILSENRSNSSVRYRNYYYTHTHTKPADKVSAEEEEEKYESHHTDGEEDDEEIVTTEILNVANAKEEEVVDDGKFPCVICEKRYKANCLNTHKAIYKKNNNK